MIWTLLLPLLWKGTLTGAALANDGTSNQIVAPLPRNAGSDFLTCLASPVNVDLGFVTVGDIIYKRKTLCGEEAESVRDGAVQLTARGLFACAKEAAAQALNSFYVDNQGKCFGSNIVVQGEGGTCFFNQLVVYSSDTPQVNCDDDPIPDVRNFVVGDFSEDVSSFVATFEPVCPGAFSYTLRLQEFMFDAVAESGKRVSDNNIVRPCTEYSDFALRAYVDQSYVADPIFAPSVTTPGVPDVRNFVVGDFSDDRRSLVATFEPVCPDAFSYELHYDGNMIDDVAVPGKRTTLSTPFPPCTEISTFALQAYDEEGNFVGDLMFAPPVTTPGDCSRIDETKQDFGN